MLSFLFCKKANVPTAPAVNPVKADKTVDVSTVVVEVNAPPDNDKPLPTVISSIAPVDAVVLPKILALVIVIEDEPTAPEPAADRLVLAPESVVLAVPPLAIGNVLVIPVSRDNCPEEFTLLASCERLKATVMRHLF